MIDTRCACGSKGEQEYFLQYYKTAKKTPKTIFSKAKYYNFGIGAEMPRETAKIDIPLSDMGLSF